MLLADVRQNRNEAASSLIKSQRNPHAEPILIRSQDHDKIAKMVRDIISRTLEGYGEQGTSYREPNEPSFWAYLMYSQCYNTVAKLVRDMASECFP